MKQLLYPTLVLLIFLSSCSEKKGSVESASPDKRITLTVSGTKGDFISPWNTSIKAEGKGLKGKVDFDFYANELSDATVSFVWDKEDNCTITFNQKDNTQRIFQFMPNNQDAMWKDMSQK